MDMEREQAHAAWRNAERIKRLSDELVRIGPWGLGLDGILAWVPWANTAYSLGAGALLIHQALRARASGATIARMGLYLAANTALTDVPVVGWAMDTLFRAHLMAARALQKDIERRYGRPAPSHSTADTGGWRRPLRASLPGRVNP